MQQPSFMAPFLHPIPYSFTSMAASHQQQQETANPLPSFHDIPPSPLQPQMGYGGQPELINTTLSHSPSISVPSTSFCSSQKDSLQQFLGSPTLSPTTSPGPAMSGSYTIPSAIPPVASITQQPATDMNSAQFFSSSSSLIAASPGSDIDRSPDTTTNFPSYPFFLENPPLPYTS